MRNGIPAWMAFHGGYGPVITASGPWKSSGEWWRADRWDREEWDVVVDTRAQGGVLYRLYRHRLRWFVEGVYD
jgi:protein ImuB